MLVKHPHVAARLGAGTHARRLGGAAGGTVCGYQAGVAAAALVRKLFFHVRPARFESWLIRRRPAPDRTHAVGKSAAREASASSSVLHARLGRQSERRAVRLQKLIDTGAIAIERASILSAARHALRKNIAARRSRRFFSVPPRCRRPARAHPVILPRYVSPLPALASGCGRGCRRASASSPGCAGACR